MSVSERILKAKAALEQSGVCPDRLEVSWETLGQLHANDLPVGKGARLYGLDVIPAQEDRVGGYRGTSGRLEVRGREWVGV